MPDDKSLDEDIVDADDLYSGQVTVEPPEEFEPCAVNRDDLEGPFYKTQYVADKIGVNRQTIINYSNFFEDVLAIRRKPGGDREYTEESIRQIAFLIHDKQSNNRTLQQESEYIKKRYGKRELELAADGVRALENFFDEMKEALLSEQRAMFEEMLSSNKQLLLEKRDEADVQLLQKLDEQAERYGKVIESQQDEIIALQKQLEEQRALLKEKEEKKGFFGWLKK